MNANGARLMYALAIGLVGVVAGAGGQTPSIAEMLTTGRQALVEGRAADARQLAEAVLRTAPGNREAALLQITALEELGEHARALGAYDTFAAQTRRQDAGLLAPVATSELRAIAGRAGPDVRLRTEALERLARAGDSGATAELRRTATGNTGTGAAMLADVALARVGDADAVARLSTAATAETTRDKSVVVEALQRSGAKNLGPTLVQLLQDPSPRTRAAAADAAGVLNEKSAVPVLRGLLADEDSRVRWRAALALKRLGDSSGDEAIAAGLKSPVSSVRLSAIEADRAPRDAARRTALKAILDDPDPLNRIRAAEAAATDDPAVARAVLMTVVGEPDLTARREACRALESLPPFDVGLFRRLLGDREDAVRVPAAGGILAAARAK
jgi:HEAT repeat protein